MTLVFLPFAIGHRWLILLKCLSSKGYLTIKFPVFHTLGKKRGREWSWSVYAPDGRVVMLGAESSRASATYKANRALFLTLLCAPYSYLSSGDGGAGNYTGRSRFRKLLASS